MARAARTSRVRRRLAPAAATGAAIVRPTRLDPPASSMVCAQCHSLRDAVASGYRAGEDYYDYFVPKLEYTPRKEQDPVYWADGRPRRFSNDAIGLWQSRCFLKGGATCTTCHDAHLPDVDRHPELAASNNALCTSCHAPIASALAEHTRHQPASAGSSCVECHMPRTVLSIKAKIRDHSISLPAPENTVSFGIPNACTECHATRSASWAVEVLAKWWPEGRRARVVERAAAFTAARSSKPEALPRLLAIAGDADQGPLMQANALGYLRNYPDARAQSALTEALAAEHPLLRMVAASSLRGPGAQASLLRALDDSRRAVPPIGARLPGQRRRPPTGGGSRSLRARERRVRRAGKNARRRSGDPGRPRTGAPAEWRSRSRLAGADEQPHAGSGRQRVRLSSSGSSVSDNSAPTKPARCSSRCPRRIRSMPRPGVSCRAYAARSRLSSADCRSHQIGRS